MENRVLLIGNIVRLGEIKRLASGAKVFDFTLRTWGKRPNGQYFFEYHPITLWGESLDKFMEVAKLNRMVRIDGQLSHYMWEDKFQKKHTRTVVRALLIKEAFLQIPPVTDMERAKFDDTQKKLFAGNESGDSAESEL